MMFIYNLTSQNVSYINKNRFVKEAGKKIVLDFLVQHVMSDVFY